MAKMTTNFQAALVRKYELRHTDKGKVVLNLNLAFNERVFNQNTQQWEDSDTFYMNAVAFDKLAENIDHTLEPGDRVVGSGNVKKKRDWTDKNGVEHTNDTEILLDTLAPDLRLSTVNIDRSYRKNRDNGSSAPASRPATKKATPRPAPKEENDPFAGDFDDTTSSSDGAFDNVPF